MTSSRGSIARALLPPALLAAVLLNVPPNTAEAEWAVQVASRMLAGDTLYKDVFCGTTPLAFMVQAAATHFVSDGFLVLRATVHALFSATLLLNAATAEILGMSRLASFAGLALLSVWLTPAPGSFYTWWAIVLMSATQCAAAWWSRSGSPRAAIIAGGFAGLTFCAKTNVGLLSLVAALTCVAWAAAGERERRGATLRQAGLLIGAFGAVVGICFLGIAAASAWEAFVAQGFTGKSVYLARGSLPYSRFLQRAAQLPTDGAWPAVWLRNTVYLAPALLVFVWPLRLREHWIPVLGAFSLAGVLGVFPRPDPHHMVVAAPALAILSAALLSTLIERQRVLAGFAALAIVAVAVQVRSSAALADSDALVWEDARILEQHAPGRTLFVLHSAAPRVYTSTRLRNPTRYDFPLVTAFGLRGQQEVIDQIEAGRVPTLCALTDRARWFEQAPEQLLKYVEERMLPGPDLGICRIYTPWPR